MLERFLLPFLGFIIVATANDDPREWCGCIKFCASKFPGETTKSMDDLQMCVLGCYSYPEITSAKKPTLMDIEKGNQECYASCYDIRETRPKHINPACGLGCKHSCHYQLAHSQLYNLDFKFMVLREAGGEPEPLDQALESPFVKQQLAAKLGFRMMTTKFTTLPVDKEKQHKICFEWFPLFGDPFLLIVALVFLTMFLTATFGMVIRRGVKPIKIHSHQCHHGKSPPPRYEDAVNVEETKKILDV